MLFLKALTFYIGTVSTVSAAAVHRVRQEKSISNILPECASPVTVTATVSVTVIDTPPTVTLAIADTSAIAQSLSTIASIDSLQISIQTQLAPVSASYIPSTATFIHTILVPGFEATEAPNNGTSVYYVSVGHNTTNWNYTPTKSLSVAIGLTTVSVIPMPRPTRSARPSGANITTTVRMTRTATQIVHPSSFTVPTAGWNNTNSNTSVVGGVGASGTAVPATSTVSQAVTHNATIETVSSTTISTFAGYGSPVYGVPDYGIPDYGAAPSYGSEYRRLARRQICTQISATMNGELVSWCNNWDGSTILTFTSWETTVIPTPAVGPSTKSTSVSVAPTTTGSPSISTAMTIPSATPSACGQVGTFDISFDDLPQVSSTDNTTVWPPIFNPFEHFYWGNGWTYVPPPTGPFSPQSGRFLAEFIPSRADINIGSPNAGLLPESSFGAGPRNYNDYYWFNANSAWVGCNNSANDVSMTCDFVATGYQWDAALQKEKVVVTQHFYQPPCPHLENCHLRQIFFNSEFVKLTTMSFYANVQGRLENFFMDSVELSWYNNTCAAGLARISSQKI